MAAPRWWSFLVASLGVLAGCSNGVAAEGPAPVADAGPGAAPADASTRDATFAGPADMEELVAFVSGMAEGRAFGLHQVYGTRILRNACVKYSATPGRCDIDFGPEGAPPSSTIRGGTCTFRSLGPNALEFRGVLGDGTATLLVDGGSAPTVTVLGVAVLESISIDDPRIGKADANHITFVDGCP